ncbi:carboxylesterase family protein [Ramlibacter sp. AN1015]|uniref:carboxylesterase/lipase family protein n=1 Tax=Ramlibacter sp. AN1015 TaxID=3133428 RepID=UPI0030BCE6D9
MTANPRASDHAEDDAAAPVVSTTLGRLRGRLVAPPGQAPVHAFTGIPYAAPPIGPLRWRPPQPVQPWPGTREATGFGPDLPQAPNARLRGPHQDEDCLYLNVWTPARHDGAALPVLVWIHGGGFVGGSGSDARSDGARMAAEGAVVVSVNYRAGLFGYLAHPALSAESPERVSGNYGLLDQLAALRWVREHIAAFGGDASRVTAFGVSAGSASIALMLVSPQARGLFDQCILHSPGAGRPLASLELAERTAAEALGGDLAALRALPAQALFERTGRMSPRVRGLTTPRVLRPIRDGWLLPEDERPALRAGRFQRLPTIVGSNLDEGSLLTRDWPQRDLAAWRTLVEANFGAATDQALALYPAADDTQVRARVAELFADTQFNYGTRLIAQAMAGAGQPTWRYLFTRRGAGQPDGPHHGEEVAHVFGNLGEAAQPMDAALSDAMRRAWVRFAATGSPEAAGSLDWKPYRPADDNHLALGDAIAPGHGWRAEPLDFLERFYG